MWPEQTGFVPLLLSISEATQPTSQLHIDFSSCYKVDSCGLTASLLKILSYFSKINVSDGFVEWTTSMSRNQEVMEIVGQLALFLPIKRFCKRMPLVETDHILFPEPKPYILKESAESEVISFPIIHIEHCLHSEKRRVPLKALKNLLLEMLMPYEGEYDINTRQLILIIYELAKNSADHTMGDSYLGLDIKKSMEDVVISFVFGDQGSGIKDHVLVNMPQKYQQRAQHLAMYESYRYALMRGFSTKLESKENFGIGLPTAIDCAKGIGLRLSVFDASSRGVLTELPDATSCSHVDLRKMFYPCNSKLPFCYYGTIRAAKL